MRIAALYDIHGNLPALEAVLAEVETAEADVILVGGDVASGPMPAQTLTLLRSLGDRARFIRGNADRVLDFAGGDSGDAGLWARRRRWVAEQLGDEALSFLAGLPLDAVLEVGGVGRVRFCHGSPGSDEEVITRLTDEERLRRLLDGARGGCRRLWPYPHPVDRTMGDTRVVNAGSVGVPYEARTGAYWLLAGPEIVRRRTPYDVGEAARTIAATGYPGAQAWATGILVDDPFAAGADERCHRVGRSRVVVVTPSPRRRSPVEASGRTPATRAAPPRLPAARGSRLRRRPRARLPRAPARASRCRSRREGGLR